MDSQGPVQEQTQGMVFAEASSSRLEALALRSAGSSVADFETRASE